MRIQAFNIGYTTKSDLELRHCGYEDCIPGFISTPYMGDCFLIHYIIQGTGYYEFNKNKYEIKKNNIFTIFPNYNVTYYAPNVDDPWVFCWFAFSGDKAWKFLAEVGIDENNPVMELPPDNSIEILIRKCIDSINNESKISSFNLNAYLYLLFSSLEYAHDSTKMPQKYYNSGKRYIETAKMYIENNYMYPISVETVSDFVSLERTYFSRLFRRYAGESPQYYIVNYRIKKAKQLLENNNMSIKEIGSCIGIQDSYYFSRVFKKIVGITPAKYRDLNSKL